MPQAAVGAGQDDDEDEDCYDFFAARKGVRHNVSSASRQPWNVKQTKARAYQVEKRQLQSFQARRRGQVQDQEVDDGIEWR